MRTRKVQSILGVVVCLGLLGSGREALAQDVAAAEALFQKGVAEMEAQQFAAACPHIAESQRLDPRPGTLYTLADCEMMAGRIATAVAHYEDYLRAYDGMKPDQQAKHADRARKASAQKAALSKEVPELLDRPASGGAHRGAGPSRRHPDGRGHAGHFVADRSRRACRGAGGPGRKDGGEEGERRAWRKKDARARAPGPGRTCGGYQAAAAACLRSRRCPRRPSRRRAGGAGYGPGVSSRWESGPLGSWRLA